VKLLFVLGDNRMTHPYRMAVGDSSSEPVPSVAGSQPDGREMAPQTDAHTEPTVVPQVIEPAAPVDRAPRERALPGHVLRMILLATGICVTLVAIALAGSAMNNVEREPLPIQIPQTAPAVAPNTGSGQSAAPAPSRNPKLALGANGQEVKRLQQALAVALNRPLPATGYFGPQTQQAVRDFQSAHGLPVTGIVDEATWTALQQPR
jgi:Putative peptidoglycan binding domain